MAHGIILVAVAFIPHSFEGHYLGVVCINFYLESCSNRRGTLDGNVDGNVHRTSAIDTNGASGLGNIIWA